MDIKEFFIYGRVRKPKERRLKCNNEFRHIVTDMIDTRADLKQMVEAMKRSQSYNRSPVKGIGPG